MPSGTVSFLTQFGCGHNPLPTIPSQDDLFGTHTVPYTCKQLILELLSHTHTHARAHIYKTSHVFLSVAYTFCPPPKHPHSHTDTRVATRVYAVFAMRATTPSCGHVSACWLLMGNHHGNQCHVMSSRSPGNLPFLFFFFFFIPLQKRGEERWYRLKKKRKIKQEGSEASL